MTRRLHPNVQTTCRALWKGALEDGNGLKELACKNGLTRSDRASLDRLRIVSIQLQGNDT
jgi:hypothetical protein